MTDLQDKTVIVGATGGIGSAVARRCAAKGQQLHLVSRGETELMSLGNELGASYSALDARDFGSLQEDLKSLTDSGHVISGVVNCAGSLLLKPAHLTSQVEFEETVSLNLTSAFSVVRAAASLMKAGAIVLCSSAAVRIGLANHEAIAAAKGGIEGLVRSAASTYASNGIRVNAVAPGLTRTPMTRKIVSNEQALKFSTSMHALGRIGEPEDVAAGICWLLGAEQSWVTGQVFAVDGGLSTINARS